MAGRDALALVLAGCVLAHACGCSYDPPPDVTLVAPPGNRFVVGDPIELAFSEPIRPESLEVIVWPGHKDLYDREGARLPDVAPLLAACTVAALQTVGACLVIAMVVTPGATAYLLIDRFGRLIILAVIMALPVGVRT